MVWLSRVAPRGSGRMLAKTIAGGRCWAPGRLGSRGRELQPAQDARRSELSGRIDNHRRHGYRTRLSGQSAACRGPAAGSRAWWRRAFVALFDHHAAVAEDDAGSPTRPSPRSLPTTASEGYRGLPRPLHGRILHVTWITRGDANSCIVDALPRGRAREDRSKGGAHVNARLCGGVLPLQLEESRCLTKKG